MEVDHAQPEVAPSAPSPLSEVQLDLSCCPAHLIRKSHIPGPPSAQDSIPALVHIKKLETAIGRERNAVDVHLDSTRVPRMISRVHSFLVFTHHQWKVRDNRSVNGVFVNDRKVHEAVLRDGDVVIFGGGGNRPIGAVLEQRDWDFKYEFRINHKWNLISPGDDASEDDTADGEPELRDEANLFEMDGIDPNTQDGMEGVMEVIDNTAYNAKKRKRGWLNTGETQSNSDSREATMAIDTVTQDGALLASTVEWVEEPISKKFCPTEVSSDAVPLLPSFSDMNGGLSSQTMHGKFSQAGRSAEDEKEIETGPVGPHDDLQARLSAPIVDAEAEKRIGVLQLELYAACEERRVMPAKYPYPDDSEVQCKACKNLIFNPTKIGCGHSLCDGCVECLVIESPNCPVCEKPVVTPILLDTDMQGRVLAIVREWNQAERAEWFGHMIKRNDRIRKAGLELLLESFRAHDVRFIHIEERWNDMDRVMFAERVDMYMAAPRISFCDAVGMTSDWIKSATFDQLLTALGNVGLSITPLVNRALKHQREKEMALSTPSSSGSSDSSPYIPHFGTSSPALASDRSASSTPTPLNPTDAIFVEAFRDALQHFTMHNRRHLQVMQHQQLQQLQILQRQQQRAPHNPAHPHAPQGLVVQIAPPRIDLAMPPQPLRAALIAPPAPLLRRRAARNAPNLRNGPAPPLAEHIADLAPLPPARADLPFPGPQAIQDAPLPHKPPANENPIPRPIPQRAEPRPSQDDPLDGVNAPSNSKQEDAS